MRLLVLTQKVDRDDDVLGFFHEWLRAFAQRTERVEVICLYEGAHDLPSNVSVHSLGKERGAGRAMRLLRLYGYLWRLRGRYDAVFVHMNPEYLVTAGWWWKLARKRVVLWYSHRQVNLKLRIAAFFSDAIASSAASSFQLETSKLHTLGHGIDTDFFAPAQRHEAGSWRLVSVGRLTPIKRLETLVEALALLRAHGIPAELSLVGQATAPGDRAYEARLRAQVKELGIEPYVRFLGPAAYPEMPGIYHGVDASVNLAPTGGLDKAVLESMASGLPTFMSNEGFAPFLGPYRERLLFRQDDAQDLANKLVALHASGDGQAVGAYLREQVVARAGLGHLIDSVLRLLEPRHAAGA